MHDVQKIMKRVECLRLVFFYEYGLNGKEKKWKKAREFYQKVEKLGFSEGTERLKLLSVDKRYIIPRNKGKWEVLIKRIEHNSLVFTLYLKGSVVHIVEQTINEEMKNK